MDPAHPLLYNPWTRVDIDCSVVPFLDRGWLSRTCTALASDGPVAGIVIRTRLGGQFPHPVEHGGRKKATLIAPLIADQDINFTLRNIREKKVRWQYDRTDLDYHGGHRDPKRAAGDHRSTD